MAGLLDYLSAPDAGNGIGGLLSYLQSPLYQGPQAAPAPQPQYDAMGNYTGITPVAPNPSGPLPQSNAPSPFQQPSVFNGGMQAAPVAGIPSLGPQGPAPQPVTPQQPPAPEMGQPLQTASVGGYQMPQFGSAGDYTSQTPTDVSAQSRAPQQQAQQQGQLPYALGGRPEGFFDRLNTGLQSIGNGGSIIGALTGNRTDPQSYSQQNLKAQYETLVPLLGPQKAMLAVMNPEAGKTLLAQALEKKNYSFQKTDGDTVLRQDPQTGKVEVAYTGGDDSRAGVAGPDGKMIPYPAGLDAAGRKVFANEIAKANADASIGKKTEVQAKSEKFGNRMELAEKNLKGLEGEGTSLYGQIASGVPLGNYVQSKEYQKYAQAKSSFLQAQLRDESGAAIGSQEYVRLEKEMFPQPGDSPSVMAQKAEARKVAIDAMKKSAGPGYKSPASSLPSGWSVSVR